MRAKYKHTNIIARDWQKLAKFYEDVFGCMRVLPERHLSGEWLEKGSNVKKARLEGAHLRLPGLGENGPTLEIFQYAANAAKLPSLANREGLSHIAFEVDDVVQALEIVQQHGGRAIGAIVSHPVPGVGSLTFVYAADPEGNLIELQSWQ
jgi:catechol 2,3-dioxygenase-like lactoylglutathione lyase family enzyme